MALRGCVDLFTDSVITGWAWDSSEPAKQVTVEIRLSGKPLAQVTSSEYREDLKEHGIGDGTHGFTYIASSRIDPTRIRVVFAGTDVPLLGWFHSIDLGDGNFTDGVVKSQEVMRQELLRWKFPDDFSGKTVLDIGCYDGGWSIAAMRRGARSVLSIDVQLSPGMKYLLDNAVFPIEYRRIDLFSQEFMDLPIFDIVIFAGVLYHVQDPLMALKRVRTKTRELVILDTHVNESLGIDFPYMIYYEKDDLGGDFTNWWGPNILCLEAMLRTAGFRAARTSIITENEGNSRVSYHLWPA
jgi:tRNA (mo5U34)-methyltransferase